MKRLPQTSALCAALTLLSAPLAADTILQTDGKSIEDIRIVNETLTSVIYKKGNDERTVPSDKVLAVEYERMPRLLDEAENLAREDDLLGAMEGFDNFVDGFIKNPKSREKWAPAYAAWRAIELRMEVADLTGVVSTASRLIQNFGDSRYLPEAYLAKANAELQMKDSAKSLKTLDSFSKLITAKSLSRRWDFECRLSRVRADTQSKGDDRRETLLTIEGEAGRDFPSVVNRARVIRGETFLEDATGISDPASAKRIRGQAREIFEEITNDPATDSATLAAAFTGLGDCLFYEGASSEDAEVLKQAAENYLRVALMFKEQSEYVPKAYFFAMRSFDLLQDRGRKARMRRELQRLYPNSAWASESQKY